MNWNKQQRCSPEQHKCISCTYRASRLGWRKRDSEKDWYWAASWSSIRPRSSPTIAASEGCSASGGAGGGSSNGSASLPGIKTSASVAFPAKSGVLSLLRFCSGDRPGFRCVRALCILKIRRLPNDFPHTVHKKLVEGSVAAGAVERLRILVPGTCDHD